MSPEMLTLETFAGRVGERLGLEVDGAPQIDLRLEAITESPAPGWRPEDAPKHRTPFSLLMLGPGEFVLPQRLYRFVHAELGTFEMFIVPVGRTAAGVSYEAVFS